MVHDAGNSQNEQRERILQHARQQLPVKPVAYPENLGKEHQQHHPRTDDIRHQNIADQKIGIEKPRNPLGVNVIQPRAEQNKEEVQRDVEEYREQLDRGKAYGPTLVTQIGERQCREGVDGNNQGHHPHIVLMPGIAQQA